MKLHLLFLRWLLINVLMAVTITTGGLLFGGRVRGMSLFTVPAILALGLVASLFAGRLCWRADEALEQDADLYAEIMHDAKWLPRWAYCCQMTGIMATMLGFYVILGHEGPESSWLTRLQGGKVALLGSFIGVFCSLVILIEHWMLEHALEQ